MIHNGSVIDVETAEGYVEVEKAVCWGLYVSWNVQPQETHLQWGKGTKGGVKDRYNNKWDLLIQD